MTLADEILVELRNGTALAEIKRKFRSQSQLYEALRKFLGETDKIVRERNEELEKTEKDSHASEAALKKMRDETEKVNKENEKLRREKEKLNREVPTQKKELARISAGITKLQSKGFTPGILKRIKAIEDRSGTDLLLQVKTIEKYRQTEKDFSALLQKKALLAGEIRSSEAKKRQILESVNSAKNELDELELQTATYKEAVFSARAAA